MKEEHKEKLWKAGSVAGAAGLGGAYWKAARDKQIGADYDADIASVRSKVTGEQTKAYNQYKKRMAGTDTKPLSRKDWSGFPDADPTKKSKTVKKAQVSRGRELGAGRVKGRKKAVRGKWIQGKKGKWKFKQSTFSGLLSQIPGYGHARLPRFLTRVGR